MVKIYDKLFIGAILLVFAIGIVMSISKDDEQEVPTERVVTPIIKTKIGKDSVYVVFGRVVKELYDSSLKTNRIIIERK
jgi:hypothetical protein